MRTGHLIQARFVLLPLALVNVALFDRLIRREEWSLTVTYGDAYRDYCARVGCYVRWRT